MLALAAIGVALALIVGDLLHLGPSGQFGIATAPLGHGSYRIVHVDRDSPASRAGIAVGDLVALPEDRITQRENISFEAPAPNGTLALIIAKPHERRRVLLRASRFAATHGLLVAVYGIAATFQVIRIVFVLVAGLIVLRRADRAEARALATFLIAFAFAFTRWPWYGLNVATILQIGRPMIVIFGIMQAVRFAAIFPEPSRCGIRRFIVRLNPLITACAVFSVLYEPFTTLVLDRATPLGILGRVRGVAFLPGLRGRRPRGRLRHQRTGGPPSERPRLRWVAISIGIGVTGFLIVLVLEALGLSDIVTAPFALLIVAIPLGTAYAILRHRMLDIAFVVNRALVFGIISALVVAAFSLLEFLLGKYLTSLGHVQSALLEALLALGIGVSLARIHERVNHIVDTVFFRERHRAEAALHRLSREASYVDDPAVLAERIVVGVDRHAGASGTALYLQDGNNSFRQRLTTLAGAPTTLERNDAAIVRMRASGEPSISMNSHVKSRSRPYRARSRFRWPYAVLSSACCAAAPNETWKTTRPTNARHWPN